MGIVAYCYMTEIEIFVLGLSLFSISIFVCGMQIMCLMKWFNELSMSCEVISNWISVDLALRGL